MLSIIVGLAGLGIVVLVHELGHFAAARAVGVEVEAFSIGWGPKVLGWKRGGTEYRLSAFPVGGYCRMKGEEGFRKALEEKSDTIPREPGSYYGAAPWRRIAIALAGPVANVVFACLVFILVALVGYTVRTNSNRIVLASEFSLDGSPLPSGLPADLAGLKSGDRITRAGGKAVRDYADVQELVALSPGKPLPLEIERAGLAMGLTVTPALDTATGAGRIGVYSWVDPVVESVLPGSPADIAGIRKGDRVAAIDGKPVRHVIEALSILASKPERSVFVLERGGERIEARLVLSWGPEGSNLGIGYATQARTVRSDGFADAVGDGFGEAWKTFSTTLKSFALLFQGVDWLKAISGPARIAWMVGRTATEGVASAGPSGIVLAFDFLALISIGLFIMNLLPIPALDGGMILICLLEAVRRKPLKTLTIYRYQLVGTFFVFGLFALAMLSDLLFATAK